ncbi:phospholipase [Pseudomonas sp. sp1636]|uniref:phospholipase n=1 Tax=Pseudomonas sp. sp1636 TaxID=3036707 RepID=UPI0025A6364B|nr:phospholipase [Pseudomonas sp. sp1636]MDM8349405.1 phospholipase [Pseudomonas sp. sp1636]
MKLPFVVVLLGLWGFASGAWAWSNHTVGSYLALQDVAALRDAPELTVEPLEQFLGQEHAGLVTLLREQETFARRHFPDYPPRPDNLALTDAPAADLRRAFLMALRVNPQIHLALMFQPMPGQDQPQRAHLKPQEVMVEQTISPWSTQRFISLAAGDKVAPLAVLATAADEPDYGHDINLFSDNPGEAGALYGFGVQSFGDERFEYSSQAPFHIGFFHESAVVYAGAPFLQRSWPDWRAYQYLDLARFAFATGHPYWGYRFLGWGLHYVQDLTQPYHATPLPGADLASMLLMEGKALAGFDADKNAAIERVATRHIEVEKYQAAWLEQVLRAKVALPMLAAYADAAQDATYPPYTERYLRDVVSAESNAQAAAFDQAIGQWLAVSGGVGDFSQGNDLKRENYQHEPLNSQLVGLLRHMGAHSRNFVKAGTAAAQDAQLD